MATENFGFSYTSTPVVVYNSTAGDVKEPLLVGSNRPASTGNLIFYFTDAANVETAGQKIVYPGTGVPLRSPFLNNQYKLWAVADTDSGTGDVYSV